jgi:hypothetical protein
MSDNRRNDRIAGLRIALRALRFLGILGLSSAVQAEVVSSAAGGFIVRNTVTVKAAPQAAYQRFIDIRSWWNPAHTYTSDSRNLSLRAEPGGCYCETLNERGFVEHLRVVFVTPGKMIRLQGGLGPLQEMGAYGMMTLKFEAAAQSTQVTLNYAVTGYAPGKGLAEIAPIVDGVLLEQLQRYAKAAGGG